MKHQTSRRRPPEPLPEQRAPVWTAPAIGPLEPPASFLEACREQAIEFDEGDLQKLGHFLALLMDANRAVNLTSIHEPGEAWMRHVFDSLTLLPFLAHLPKGARVIDVGSGGGLPGIPLAISLPAITFTLLEATGKKAAYLSEVVRALNLKNVTVLNARAETAGHYRGEKSPAGRVGAHRESYDAVIARAVGPTAVVAELTVPFAKQGAPTLLIKGQKADDELVEAAEALKRLHAVHAATTQTPTGRIVVLEKSSLTPRDYPRRDGEPKRSPLGVSKARRS